MPFDVYFLGAIDEINMGNSRKRDTEAQLVDQVEEAQVCECRKSKVVFVYF